MDLMSGLGGSIGAPQVFIGGPSFENPIGGGGGDGLGVFRLHRKSGVSNVTYDKLENCVFMFGRRFADKGDISLPDVLVTGTIYVKIEHPVDYPVSGSYSWTAVAECASSVPSSTDAYTVVPLYSIQVDNDGNCAVQNDYRGLPTVIAYS